MYEDEIERPVSDQLIRNPDVTTAGVADFSASRCSVGGRSRSATALWCNARGARSGSCRSMRTWRSFSTGDGAIPSSSSSVRLNLSKLNSASACRPEA